MSELTEAQMREMEERVNACISPGMTIDRGRLGSLLAKIQRLQAENERLMNACVTMEHEVAMTLAPALGYRQHPEDGGLWDYGEHTAVTLAMEAAKRLTECGNV